MRLTHHELLDLTFPDREFSYSERDTMVYALGVGMGRVPDELPFVFERSLQALPTQAVVVAWDDTWQDTIGLDVSRVVHGEQRVTLHQPLPAQGRVRARFRIQNAFDKGLDRGAVLLARTELTNLANGLPLATLLSTVFARGDGGYGGPNGRGPAPHGLPVRPADFTSTCSVRPEQAAIYRISGDRNPLHIDPGFARAAGFDRPILHGLCTWGMVGAQVLRTACALRPERLQHLEARFTAPVYAGETLRTELWIDGERVSFRTTVEERGQMVLDHGMALVSPA